MVVALSMSAATLNAQSLNYGVSGSLEGIADGTTIVLRPVATTPKAALDSAKVSNGTFSLSGSVSEPTAAILSVGDSYGGKYIILGDGNITVSGKPTLSDSNGSPYYDFDNVKANGSAMTDKYQSILDVRRYLDILYTSNNEAFAAFHKAYGEARAAKNTAKCDSLNNTDLGKACHIADSLFFKTVEKAYHDISYDNRDSFFGPLSMVSLFAYLTPEQKSWYDEFSDAAKASQYGKMVKKDVAPESKVGTKASAFGGTDINGKSISLTNVLKGKKYILIDFWASWCVPCRKEIPNVKAQYEKYKSKGFDVVSVSIDKRDADWRKAVKAEGLSWTNLRDTDGSISRDYEVKAVPTMLLVDSTGTIVMTDARGEALANKLAELLK